MSTKPALVAAESIYKGQVFDVEIATIRDGESEYKREIVVHKGSCVILPVFEDGTVALVRQYRHAAGKYLLEACAGTLNAGEDPEAGAARELEEEIGVTAGKVEHLASFFVSPGFLTEKMHLYLATELTETQQRLEEDEDLTIERIPLAEAAERAERGEYEDAKTVIGLLLARQRLG